MRDGGKIEETKKNGIEFLRSRSDKKRFGCTDCTTLTGLDAGKHVYRTYEGLHPWIEKIMNLLKPWRGNYGVDCLESLRCTFCSV